MSYSWGRYILAYERRVGEAWTAVIDLPSPQTYENAVREHTRLKCCEFVYPDRYRDVRLIRETTSVQSKDISP